jgi:hypothetical protein
VLAIAGGEYSDYSDGALDNSIGHVLQDDRR